MQQCCLEGGLIILVALAPPALTTRTQVRMRRSKLLCEATQAMHIARRAGE